MTLLLELFVYIASLSKKIQHIFAKWNDCMQYAVMHSLYVDSRKQGWHNMVVNVSSFC